MATMTDIGAFITCTSDIRGGRPRIAGTGITVRRIAGWSKLGLAPEEMVHRIGHVTLAQVHAALAYYYANREEIEFECQMDAVQIDRKEWGV